MKIVEVNRRILSGIRLAGCLVAMTAVLLAVSEQAGGSQFTEWNATRLPGLEDTDPSAPTYDLFTGRADTLPDAGGKSVLPGGDAVLRGRAVDVHTAVADTPVIAKGDVLRLDLFDDRAYSAQVDRVAVNVNGTVTVRARIEGQPLGYVLISTTGGRSHATVSVPGKHERYLVQFCPDEGGHRLFEVDMNAPPALEDAPSEAFYAPSACAAERERIEKQLEKSPGGPFDAATIDVMMVYTQAAMDAVGGEEGMANAMAQAMETSQLVLDNSGAYAQLNLVHAAQVAYTDSGSLNADLVRLVSVDDGFMDEIHAWRDRCGADLVTLVAEAAPASAGVSYILNSITGNAAYGFSVVNAHRLGSSYALIHELGHNFGLHHHKQQLFQPGPGVFSYSAGWRWVGLEGGRHCCVMTYEMPESFADGQRHTQVAHLSNPAIQHNGTLTGHQVDGDNARTLREMKHVIAAYREGPMAAPELPEPLSPGSPDAPGPLITGTTQTFRWHPSPGAARYRVYCRNIASGGQIEAETSAAALSIGGLLPGTAYSWEVRALNDLGESDVTSPWFFQVEDHCAVSPPTAPGGPAEGVANTEYSFTAENAACSNGHSLQYRFDWGDGRLTDWDGAAAASAAWGVPGAYEVRAQARCAVTQMASAWSQTLAVTVEAAADGPDSAPPEVGGLSVVEARALLEAEGWQYLVTFECADAVPANHIVRSYTILNDAAPGGMTVVLVVSSGPCQPGGCGGCTSKMDAYKWTPEALKRQVSDWLLIGVALLAVCGADRYWPRL